MLDESKKNFQFWANTQLPELLSSHECLKSTEEQSDRIILEYRPSRECAISEIKDKLIDVLEMKPIYSGFEPNITDGGKTFCCCSRSGSNMMVKIFVKTGLSDKVLCAIVTIFESIDDMVFEIADDLSRHEAQGRCKIETPLNHLYAEFIK